MEVLFISGCVGSGFILGCFFAYCYYKASAEVHIQARLCEVATDAYVRGEKIGFQRASLKFRTENLLKKDRQEVSNAG